MRGRHSFAILKQMGVCDTIATSIDDYIEIAVRLGSMQVGDSTSAVKLLSATIDCSTIEHACGP